MAAAQRREAPTAALWAALSEALAIDAAPPSSSAGDTRSGVATDLDATIEMLERFLDDDLERIVIIDLGRARATDGSPEPARQRLREAVEAIAAAYPGAEVRCLGPDDGMVDTVARLVAEPGTASPDLVSGALERAFGREPGTLVRYRPSPRHAPIRHRDRAARERGQRPRLHERAAV